MSGRLSPGAGGDGTHESTNSVAFEAVGVSRRFGATQALDSVDFDLRAGEIHALVGENGAGKTTLAKIVAGTLRPDAGTLRLFGERYTPRRRSEGSAAGVAHVRQQLSLVRGLTVAQNIELGRPRQRPGPPQSGAASAGESPRARPPGGGLAGGWRPWPRPFNARAARAEVERLAGELDLAVPATPWSTTCPWRFASRRRSSSASHGAPGS